MMTQFARYKKERENVETLEKDYGFATYKFYPKGNYCYIIDIYVLPERRRERLASTLADEIKDLAQEAGIKHLVGTVDPTLESATDSIKTLLGYGMKLLSSESNKLVFFKEI